VPDEIFGERVGLYAELQPGAELELGDVVEFLTERGVSREWFPERLVVLDSLPRASGGKVAKGELRRLSAEHSTPPRPAHRPVEQERDHRADDRTDDP
jgi:non-ribosomal peptide synthetase component E (peptide arylation enzyme)